MDSKQKPTQKRYPRPRRKEAAPVWGRGIEVPDAALWLAEDTVRLDLIVHLLKQINPLHIGNIMTQAQRWGNDRKVRTTIAMVRGWQATARDKLKHEYIAP